MSRRTYLFLLLTLLVCIVGIASASESRDGSYIVVLEDSVQAPGRVAENQVGPSEGEVGFVYRHAIEGYSAELSAEAVEELRDDPRVKYVVKDRPVELAEEIEIDTKDDEWVEPLEAIIPTGISRTFAAGNKRLDIDGQDDTRADVDVAVIDTGVDPGHPDLNVVTRVDCTSGTCKVNSGTTGNHGTHVAGTIGALDNGIGVVGMAPGARLWSIKVLEDGGGKMSAVIAGTDWVAGNSDDIEVGNMSLGSGGFFLPLLEALQESSEDGVVYAVSAGNQSINASAITPANIGKVLTVSALADYDGKPGGLASPTCNNYGLDDRRATFSNFGSVVDLVAPGACILSTQPAKTYGVKSGTSMSAPHVAGAAAILAAKENPNSTEDVEAIQSTLISTGNYNWVDNSGDGTKEPLLDVHDEGVYSLVGPPELATGPLAYTGVGTEAAPTLTGTVNPNGLSTTYQFEYVSAAKYKPEAENPYAEGAKAPASAASIGSGEKGEALAVKEALSGLEANTTYHYRLVAENSEGSSKTTDQTFVSPSACKGAEGKCAWSLQSAANPAAETINDLEDVSCPSATMCLAVGNDHYLGKGFSEYWNGSSWKIANSFNGEMKAVSCPTVSWCMTVAKSDAKGWQLKWWEVESSKFWGAETNSPPTPEGASQLLINDVSCSSETACTVVGRYYSGSYKPYVARWNGSSWSLQSAPSPAEGNASEAMLGVSCASASFCVAVGKAASKPFVERWNGSEWTIQSAPNPSGATEAVLEGISCTSETVCMAVGNSASGGLPKALAERWNGSSWSVTTNPAPAKEGHVALRGVSCVSASSCVAVGSIRSVFLTSETTLAETWNGTEWTIPSTPNPEGKTASSLAAVSCSSSTACTAVGQAGPSVGDANNTVTLAERWTGTWSLQSAANPAPETINDLEDVSCPSATMCMAVGSDHYKGKGFSEYWNGSSWKIANSFNGEMKAVSCPISTWCMTIAKSEVKGWQLKWIEMGPSKFWGAEAKSPPTPEGASQLLLYDVSCSSESACTVVGRYYSGSSYKPYVARWNGSSWSLQSAPSPAEGNASEAMLAVSCASATYCVAVGKAASKPFAERWNGSEWTIQSVPNPSGATSAVLEGISCPSEGACVAVGNSQASGGLPKALSERWNGSTWSVTTNPTPGKEGHVILRGVSCLSASSCVAVGSIASVFLTSETTLAETWNGSEWTISTTPNPEGKTASSLSAISCSSPTACTAVGQAGPNIGDSNNTVTLAERWG